MFGRLSFADVGLAVAMLFGVLLTAFLSSQNSRLRQENSLLAQQVSQFKKQAIVTNQRLLKLQEMAELATKKAEKTTALYKQQKNALKVANEKHKNWANEPVPDDVIRVFELNH
ncbi:hypothetical protein L4F92_07730 [Avibacterium sp. 21-595]|uniref:hypothetical protein n=1 Tax=Avibacterium sp. 21-595 TaxID=2911527 RepID=UPI0020260629|nr:hypothetical protein [Avibacterium sp. 21-595]URL05963.1 hypothetical protein L4F92_07730 [Avibacterium sp. 21-595]